MLEERLKIQAKDKNGECVSHVEMPARYYDARRTDVLAKAFEYLIKEVVWKKHDFTKEPLRISAEFYKKDFQDESRP